MSGAMRGATRLSYAAYGLLGLPLAMSALPIYIQAPAYYTGHLGLALAGTGWVLFLSRLVDTLQDPWLGRCIDRLHGLRLKVWLMAAADSGAWFGHRFAGMAWCDADLDLHGAQHA